MLVSFLYNQNNVMKRKNLVLLLIPSLLCFSCTNRKAPKIVPQPFVPSGDFPSSYNEVEDSLDGVDASDLSHLKKAFQSIEDNYTLKQFSYFTPNALKLYESDYKTKYSQNTATVHTKNYEYTFSFEQETRFLNDYNEVVIKNKKPYQYAVIKETPQALFELESFNYKLKEYEKETPSSLGNLYKEFVNSNYTRISKNKYQTSEQTILDSLLPVLCPNIKNNGYFMTFERATFEIDDSDALTRVRLYTSQTQIGKIVDSHKNKDDMPNWYLLFAEAEIYNINQTGIPCLDNLTNN